MDQLQKNKDIVRRFNKEFIEGGDLTVLEELVHPDFINRTAATGARNDREATGKYITDILRKTFPDLTVEIYTQVAEGDLVTTHKAFHATHIQEFMGIPATGKKIIIPVMDIVRLKDGKYIEHWGIRNMTDVLEQLKS
ncbi:ester cyclase [Rubrolithibacter danxiaensis]|uniref:ester cyclase n=1 Tax=Rubrolithibacter danxiaensis TaxID=3390805 RepID=UPI003BF798A3